MKYVESVGLDSLDRIRKKIDPLLYECATTLRHVFNAEVEVRGADQHRLNCIFRKMLGESDFYLELECSISEDVPGAFIIGYIRTQPKTEIVDDVTRVSDGYGSAALRCIENTVTKSVFAKDADIYYMLADHVLTKARGFWTKMGYSPHGTSGNYVKELHE